VTAFPCRLLLLDLDGTLVDSAPDLHRAANCLRQRRGEPALPFEAFRPLVSRGGTAMLQQAFPDADAAALALLLPEFLACYAASIAVDSRVFAGMQKVLTAVEDAGARWGVVTNKPEALAQALLEGLQLNARCAVLIGGDTVGARKPDPAPLLEACRRLSEPADCAVYVGDDPRDIDAARAAGMPAIAAGWGYLQSETELSDWGADHIALLPADLLASGVLALERRGG
jgi:phosphoglycolate phosphatase